MKEEEKKKESRICFVPDEETINALEQAENHFKELFDTKPSKSLLIRALISSGSKELEKNMMKGRIRQTVLPALEEDEAQRLQEMSLDQLVALHNQLAQEDLIEGMNS